MSRNKEHRSYWCSRRRQTPHWGRRRRRCLCVLCFCSFILSYYEYLWIFLIYSIYIYIHTYFLNIFHIFFLVCVLNLWRQQKTSLIEKPRIYLFRFYAIYFLLTTSSSWINHFSNKIVSLSEKPRFCGVEVPPSNCGGPDLFFRIVVLLFGLLVWLLMILFHFQLVCLIFKSRI